MWLKNPMTLLFFTVCNWIMIDCQWPPTKSNDWTVNGLPNPTGRCARGCQCQRIQLLLAVQLVLEAALAELAAVGSLVARGWREGRAGAGAAAPATAREALCWRIAHWGRVFVVWVVVVHVVTTDRLVVLFLSLQLLVKLLLLLLLVVVLLLLLLQLELLLLEEQELCGLWELVVGCGGAIVVWGGQSGQGWAGGKGWRELGRWEHRAPAVGWVTAA